jgi:hypothetical protein
MEEIEINNNIKKISLIERISPKIIFNSIFPFFNKEKKYILPLLLTDVDQVFIQNLKNDANKMLNEKEDKSKNKIIMINDLIILYDFFSNCKLAYKEQIINFNKNISQIIDPIEDILIKAEKETNNLINSGLNYKKYFYFYLMSLPYIIISPCTSIMNIIYLKEYYKSNKKQKIKYVILYLNEEVAKCRINDLFEEILFNQYNLVIKNKTINFDFKAFTYVISHIYKLYDINTKIIINCGDKTIKHNFKNKNEFIIDSVLFKIKYISNSLLIIFRV